MNTTSRTFLTLAGAALLLAAVLGAYGSHALAASLPLERMTAYRTAVDYQFFHGLGLLGVALLTDRYPRHGAFRLAGWLLAAGLALFCGALYATTFGAPAVVGLVAPIGGTALMLAWLTLTLGAWLAGQRPATDPPA